MEHSTEQVKNGGELPLVVWLRGDEEDFTLSAEDVMAALDIKRSRLTQISGRELRVGRRRVERYLKPFYRPADVHAYQQRTRAAVTRQRSADAINAAASDIESRNKKLMQEHNSYLLAALTTTTGELQKSLSTLLFATQQKLSVTSADNFFSQTQKLMACFEKLQHQLRTLFATFEQQTLTAQDSAAKKMQDMLQTQQEQQRTLTTLQQTTSSQHAELVASNAAHTAQLLALQQNSEALAQQLQEIPRQYARLTTAGAEHLAQQLDALTQSLTEQIEQALAAVSHTQQQHTSQLWQRSRSRQMPRSRNWPSLSP